MDSDEELLATAISISKFDNMYSHRDSTDIVKLKQLLNPKAAFNQMDKKLK